MKTLATRLLLKTGLFQVVFDYYNTVRGLSLDTVRSNRLVRGEAGPNDPPLPPLALVTSATGTPSLRWFVESGASAATSIHDALSRAGVGLADVGVILDFGCGCGRVVRHLPSLTQAAVHGVDVNSRAVHWCREHLASGSYQSAALQPPLQYPDRAFDLIYSLSVFTHLPEQLQLSWALELLRLLKPGGHLLIGAPGQTMLTKLW